MGLLLLLERDSETGSVLRHLACDDKNKKKLDEETFQKKSLIKEEIPMYLIKHLTRLPLDEIALFIINDSVVGN